MNLPLKSVLVLGGCLFVLAAWLVHHFAAPKTSLFIRTLVTISFALGFGGIVLLPIDLTVTTVYKDGNEGVGPNATYGLWMLVYWSTFFLAWVVLPMFREALLSGQFTFLSRLQAGCRKAVRGYILLIGVAVASVLFLAVKLKSWNVVPVLMALGNTYGLLLVALLLGYGLVDFPRQLWRQANPEIELRRTQIIAGDADEALFEAVWELQDCEALIDKASERIGSLDTNGDRGAPMNFHYARCVDNLLTLRNATAELSPEMQRRRTGGQRRLGEDESEQEESDEGIPSIEYLAKLKSRLQHAQAQVVSAEQRWNSLVVRSNLYKDLVDESVPQPSPIQVEPGDSSWTKLCTVLERLYGQFRYVWLLYLRSYFYHAMGVSCAVLSGVVMWSEATLAATFNLSPFAWILRMFDGEGHQERGLLFQLSALLPLLYMSLCVYSSLFKLSIFGSCRLRGRKQSPGVALVFNAQYLVRLQFPLGYNYLLMLKYDVDQTDCAFSHVMKNMETVPFLGTSFSVYAPLLILALCGFTLCNGYARLLGALGFEHEDAILVGDQETLDSKVNEGITLLRRSGNLNPAPASEPPIQSPSGEIV